MKIDLALLELGVVMIVLATLGRLAYKLGLPATPFYLVAGLFFGEGGFIPIQEASEFIDIGSSLGVIFLLFVLGLEYTPSELRQSLMASRIPYFVDLIANAVPGFVVGLILGWGPLGATMLAGITYVSSSGVVAKLLVDLGRLGNRETPGILSTLVIEDLVMAVFLPVVAVLLAGDSAVTGLVSGIVALGVVLSVIALPSRAGHRASRFVDAKSDEVLLISLLGVALFIAGAAEYFHVSYAIGAFLVGIVLSGQVAERARILLGPLRDSFAALFFVSFGLTVDTAALFEVLPIALLLAALGAVSKFGSGYLGARRLGASSRGARRAGVVLIPRGEFSIVLAGLAIAGGIDADLGPITVAYVLLLATGGSVASRFVT
jgi:CPA2 family monovalent cation:H+ antiporter-2